MIAATSAWPRNGLGRRYGRSVHGAQSKSSCPSLTVTDTWQNLRSA